MGALLLPSERFCAVRKPCAAGCQNGVLCRFWVLAGRCSRRTQKAFGTAMRLCVSLSRGVAAPLGCVIFSLLSKLRPVRPIPETSFSSPDAPACAVPVQATSQLVSFRLEADRGFSVLSLCLTSFFDFGDKKRPLISHTAVQINGRFLIVISRIKKVQCSIQPNVHGKSTKNIRSKCGSGKFGAPHGSFSCPQYTDPQSNRIESCG